MRISNAFPSKYLKAADLQGREVNVCIHRVEMVEVGTPEEPDTKPVLYFSGKDKGLVLNKTNANTIAGIYGDDTDDWAGQWITLFESQTDFQGRQTPCIRVKLRPPQKNGAATAPKPAARRQTVPERESDPLSDDDIPF